MYTEIGKKNARHENGKWDSAGSVTCFVIGELVGYIWALRRNSACRIKPGIAEIQDAIIIKKMGFVAVIKIAVYVFSK